MQKIKIRYLLTACIGGLIGLMSFMRVAYAETHITESYINTNEYWSASSSPYIVDTTVNINPDQTLTVGPGVSIVGSPLLQGYEIFYVQGNLSLNGKPNKRITINGEGSISTFRGTTSIAYADISLPDGLYANRSSVSISSTTISNAYNGIWSSSSKVDIQDSRIDKNKTGIYVQASGGGVFQVNNKEGENGEVGSELVRNNNALFTGGIGNAFNEKDNDSNNTILAMNTPIPSEIKIMNSSISGNEITAIQNNDTESISATNNWWGTEAGPSTVGENKISGFMEYSPWLPEDPFVAHKKPKCCSSILFIPGLEASRLYRDESWPILGTVKNRLWEPNRNADVEKLFLDNNGSSTDPSIYSGGPIDKALGFEDIYSQFMGHLDDLSKDGTIKEWKAFGYDWRKPITEVVAGAEKKATTTESLIQTVTDLSSHSNTGKVTIVAHSNGGLVAKYLVKVLTDMGKESMIDSVISVAVPYLGTPQAIAGLLHGDNQSILGGLILKDSVARNLGINMASAYSLLPSKEYFMKVFGPTIAFAATTTAGINDGSYPKQLDTFEGQSDFIADKNNVRITPSVTSPETFRPIKGNQKLMLVADIIHGIIDPFSWPASISRWSILGWGLKTTSGVVYSEKDYCKFGTISLKCSKGPTYTTIKNTSGDGTVVSPSAAFNSGTQVAVNLAETNLQENKNINHAGILEASSTRAAVDAIVTRNPAEDDSVVMEKLKTIPGVTIGEPDFSKGAPSYLKLSTHSPVELHVYDSAGRHTGIIPKPTNLDEDVEDGLYTFTESKIIGSSFESVGGSDTDPEYQIYLPDDNGEKYSVVLNGTGIGEFTFDVDRVKDGATVDNVEYAYLPVTPLTIATATIIAGKPETVLTPNIPLASTTPVLNIDIDGNGSTDIKATPNMLFDPLIYLEAMKTTVSSIAGNLQKGKNIIKRIDKIENLIKKGKYEHADRVIANLDKRVSNMKFKKLSDAGRQQILDMIDTFIAQYE